jgi:cysteine desulfurase
MRCYLDHNATSPLRPAARRAMLAASEVAGNASSIHAEGRAARKLLDDARDVIAKELGVLPGMVVFTSGGSEANNLAIKGAAVDRILVSAIEHPSVLEAARATGKPVEVIPVTSAGLVDLAALAGMLPGPKGLVSVMLANNETGAIQPLREIAALAASHGSVVHTDAVQALGKLNVNFGLLGVDLMSVSAHKLGGPQGCGALIVRDGTALEPLIHGGAQELRRRAGTEKMAAIAGVAAGLGEKNNKIRGLRGLLEFQLEPAVILSRDVERLPNTTCLAAPGLLAETLVMAFDLDGIAISSGSACSSGKVSRSHVLTAMGVAPEVAVGAIRVSLGWSTTEEDIATFIAAWHRIVARQRSKAAA